MNVTVKCKLSLSKKLRKLVEEGATISFVSSEIVGGNGVANLSMSVKDDFGYEEVKGIGETSLIITPLEVGNDMPENIDHSVASLFSTTPAPTRRSDDQVSRKIAVTVPPEEGQQGESFVSREEVQIPEQFAELNDPDCVSYINDYEDLIDAVREAVRHKKSDINLDEAENDRERAVLMELKEQEEAIDVPAWIVNDSSASLTLNDLDVDLKLNQPFDLSRISAKRIMRSGDLKGCLRAGLIKLITPDEVPAYIESQDPEGVQAPSLDTFDRSGAEANIFTDHEAPTESVIIEGDADEWTEDDLAGPTEEESMIMNLTAGTPSVKKVSNGGVRTSSHGNGRKTTHSGGAASGGPKPKGVVKPRHR